MGDLSAHFDRAEFACRDGCGFASVDQRLIDGLEELRALLDAPITISSGCRCPKHNAAVGGSPNSRHMLGQAADIFVRLGALYVSPQQIYEHARGVRQFGGFGVDMERHFLHVDTRGQRATWRYLHGKVIDA